MHGGFEVWLLIGVVPIYAFLRHSSKVPNFHDENPMGCHPTFAAEIRHCLPSVTRTVTITPTRASRYIYTYIMHNAYTQSGKVNAYIPKAWPKI